MIEAVAAGIIGLALLWLVMQPMLDPTLVRALDLDIADPEETPRGQALLALKEIEFDRATGKLSESDFHLLNSRYTALALATMAAHDAPLHCRVHGARTESDAHFCSDCGAGLVTDANACAACAFVVPEDAAYCPGCGVRVRPEG